ncbi:hypothetical protein AQJ91_46780 [Streptomyces dysideae]|uniref:Uncharacterized protein n=1 Tax=Streptomyces dysideae TaxID=909626 RepID=A0A101UPC5_9ACTN|nr:hypothetical protein AQJ91_46780 [Streptomyces dysideae]
MLTPSTPSSATAEGDPGPRYWTICSPRRTGPYWTEPVPHPARTGGPRRIQTHLSHTNPLVDPAAPADALASEAGADVLPDATEFVL